MSITPEKLIEILGNPKFKPKKVLLHQPGMAIGLAWTQVGGTILEMETSLSRGSGQLKLTGHLGEVMKESAITALSWIKSNGHKWGINQVELLKSLGVSSPNHDLSDWMSLVDVHVHFPAAATPKDGPSAGITICSALVSAFTQKILKRIAMTGEMTLTGKVLPIGGVKEKVMGAIASGVYTIILPKENLNDFEECELEIKSQVKVRFVERIDEVLKLLLDIDPVKSINSNWGLGSWNAQDSSRNKAYDNMSKL